MSILSRYIFCELLKVFLITLSTMTAIMLLVGVVHEAVRENLTPLTILQLIPYVLPNALCFAIPGTMLFSTCIVLGRMSSANEVVAIKTMGVSPMVVVWPVLFLAFVMSLVTVLLNDLAVSWGREGVYRVVLHSVEKTIYAVLNTQHSYQNGRVSIFVDDVQGDQLIRPVVRYYKDDDGSDMEFTASTAKLSVDPARDLLIFSVENTVATMAHQNVQVTSPYNKIDIPLRDATKRTRRNESPSNLPLRVIPKEIVAQRRLVATQRKQLAMQSAFQMLGGDFVSLTHPRWTAQLSDLSVAEERIDRLRTEPWRRWANGFSCLCFVFIGAPLAIYMRKSDFWNTFAVCFIPILLAYYPLLMFGVGRAKNGDLPPPIVWLGNAVLLAIGWILLKKTLRH